ncbi:hypothetical protein [Paenibacillus sp. HGF7]|uniref:hypothetical protein n=1 Tax=Paenibacillus sp. HGF7 TaxID=944559 RepID=UPI00110FA4B5|nr:hypothetical protein [Paenibacillus sp. HGF7]
MSKSRTSPAEESGSIAVCSRLQLEEHRAGTSCRPTRMRIRKHRPQLSSLGHVNHPASAAPAPRISRS